MKDRNKTLAFFLIFTNLLTLVVVAMLMVAKADLLNEIKDLKTDVTMYESMVEGLILTNREQYNMILDCEKLGDLR